MPAPPACTPQALAEIAPCFRCLSETQLRMVFMFLWAILDGYDLPEDLDQLVEDSKCFTCLSQKQILEQKVAILADFLGATDLLSGQESVIEDMRCFPCLSQRQIDAAILFLICDFLTGGFAP